MTIYCDAEYCEYNEDGICYADRLDMDGNGVCMTIRTVVNDESEVQNDEQRG